MKIKLPGYANSFSAALLNFIVTFLSGMMLWYGIQKETKMVSIALNSCVPIISTGNRKIQNLDIRYNNKSITSLYDVEILVRNDGNSPIKRDDFSESLKVKFNGEIEGKMVVGERNPPQISPNIIKSSVNCIEIEPLLLNQNDSFKIKLKVLNMARSDSGFEVEGRIVGVNKIVKNNNVRYSNVSQVLASLLSGWIGISVIVACSILVFIGLYNILLFFIEKARLYFLYTKRNRIH